jgi:hypothetical protein
MIDATPGLSWATRIQGDRPTGFDTAAYRGRKSSNAASATSKNGPATCHLPPAHLPRQTRHPTPRHAPPHATLHHDKIASYRAAAILDTTVTWTACLSNAS